MSLTFSSKASKTATNPEPFILDLAKRAIIAHKTGLYSLLLFGNLLFLNSEASAQLDTEFWFVAPEVWANHGDNPILLRFSTLDEAATVTVDQPANPGFPVQSISINAEGTGTIDLTSWLGLIENKPSNQVLTRGLRIVSSAPITVYYEVNHPLNTDIFTLKGASALGTSYHVPFQTNLANNFSESTAAMDVIATEDGTEVTVIPTENLNGHPAGVPFSFMLNTGETYGMRANSVIGSGHPAGTVITSNNPIAVTVSDDSVLNGICWDMMGDQIIPNEAAGTKHIAVKGNLSSPDKVYLVATEDGTVVFINGIEVWTLNAGESYSHTLTSPTGFYETSAPVIALHVTGFGCEVGQALLPPIECTGSTDVSFVRSTNEFFGMKIIVRSGGEGNFTLNGSAANVGAGVFADVPGTNGDWKYANITASAFVALNTAYQLSNSTSKFHLGIINGGAETGTRYGYFSSFTQFEHETFVSDDNLCEGELAELYCTPIPGATYEWSGPNGFTESGEAIQFGPITLADTGMYVVSGMVEGCEILPDTLQLLILEQPEAPSLLNIPNLCEGDDWAWTAITPADEWLWLNDEGVVVATDSTVLWTDAQLADSGSYELVITENQCASPAVPFEVVVNETINIDFASAVATACSGNDWTFAAEQNIPLANWIWTLPDGSEINAEEFTLSPVASIDAGIYTLSGVNDGCPMVSNDIELIVAEPVPLMISAPPSICSADDAFELSVDDFFDGSWSSTSCPTCLSESGTLDPSIAGEGILEVNYESTSPCATNASTTIEVILTPNANFTDFTACEGEGEVQMVSEVSGGIWSANCGTCSNEAGIFDTEVAGTGIWEITYAIGGICPASAVGSFSVTPNTSSDFTLPDILCANAPTIDLIAENSAGTWSATCDGCIENDGSFSPDQANVGVVEITYTIPGNCGSVTAEEITVLELPNAGFEFSVESDCAPALVTLVALDNTDVDDCQWGYSGIGANGTIGCDEATLEIPVGGCFELNHTVIGSNGCSNTSFVPDALCLNEPPAADFQINPANPSLLDEFITLTANEAADGNAYNWDLGNAIQSSGSEVEILVSSIGLESFEVCLEVTDPLNCTSEDCRSVALMEELTAFAPTAFTPDQDGRNDAWQIVCSDAVTSFELHIFDRWGTAVFQSTNKDDVWFGDVQDGTHFAADGIYHYRAVLRGENYEVRILEGAITLIR